LEISLVVALFSVVLYQKGKIKLITCTSVPVLALYLSFVTTTTIFSRAPFYEAQYNLLLFWSYKAIANGELELIAQIFWNVVLFIPIGILLMLILTCKHKVKISVVVGLLLSALIELMQLVSYRGLFEFDDIVHNTLGVVIGIVLYIIVSSIVKRLTLKRVA
jgi:glycopeptide antibiotics resistance protein